MRICTLLRLATMAAMLAFILIPSDSATVLATNHRRRFDMPEFREAEEDTSRRRAAVGPGSSPPKCLSRCGRCLPCKPVHVTIRPGLAVPLEYYPEAWRCKCRNKLFLP